MLKKELEKSRKANTKNERKKNLFKHKLTKLREKVKARKSKPLTKKQKYDVVREALKDIFTPAQIECYLKGSKWKQGRWTQDDYSLAMTIRIMSRKTYRFLREKKLLALPGISTLQKYFSKFRISEGFMHPVGHLLKVMAETMTDTQKVIGLAFDEVHLRKDISYDSQEDKIVGPHSKANTMLIRGIFKKFKLPVWYRYDTALKKDELFEIIQELESLGYHVVSLTSDMGPDNRALAKSLGISPENTKFENPSRPGHFIYYFYDVPHLLKLIRNNLLKYGFILPKSEDQFTPVNKSMFENVFDQLHKHGEITIAQKLQDETLLEVSGQDKQNVAKAAKLLSETMANTIKFLYPNDPNMQALAEFVALTDQWFDVLNSSREESPKRAKCAYGTHRYLQSNILKKFRELVLNLKVMNGQESKMPWQIGVAVSSTSLIEIGEYLRDTYHEFTITTVVFNQDIVENTFSRLRGMGGSETRFGALTYKYRLRDYTLGSMKDISIGKAAVICDQESVQVLTAEISREFIENQSRPPAVEVHESEQENAISDVFKTARGKKLPTVTFVLQDDENVEKIVDLEDFSPEEYTEMPGQSEGYVYIAGTLAKKDAPNLAVQNNEDFDKTDFTESKWLNLMKSKKLNLPRDDFVRDLKKMDELFVEHHKNAIGTDKYSFTPNDLPRTSGVVKDFADLLFQEFPQYHQYPYLLRRFAKGRTMFRMRMLQKSIAQTETCRSKVTTIAFTY